MMRDEASAGSGEGFTRWGEKKDSADHGGRSRSLTARCSTLRDA